MVELISLIKGPLLTPRTTCNNPINVHVHLRNLLTHTLLFWHFHENLNFEFKTILEYIRTMFSGDACLRLETSDLELLKYGSLS